MIGSIRRMSSSKIGGVFLALFVLAIGASFALADLGNTLPGGVGTGSGALVEVGSEDVTDADMTTAMDRRLSEVRQQNPEATYSTIAADFEALLSSLVDGKTLQAFADKFGFSLSKRLVDAEIANIPGTRGLNGQFSDDSYRAFLAQQRITDAQVRDVLASGLLQRLLMTPAVTNARMPVGVARPYASMLLEARQGEVAIIPVTAFSAGLNPNDQQLQQYYSANRNRYMVPEQRVLRLARLGPEMVANVAATDQEIASAYRANQAQYAAKDLRTLSQAVVPDRVAADAIAARAKGGANLAAAAAPAGLAAGDVTVGEQTRQQFTSLAGEAVAAATFAAAEGAVVGPVQSDLGWHVVKVESIRRESGRSLEQARGEIAARLTAEKRKNALTDILTRVEDQIAEGANLSEAAASVKVPVTETPLVTSAGTSRSDPGFRLPAEYAAALRSGFELTADDEPVVETLPNDTGFVVVAPGRIVAAAPAPFAEVRDRVRTDWTTQQATARARAAATAIAGKTARNVPLAQAVREAGGALPPVQNVGGRRIELSQMAGQGQVPPPLQMLFSLGEGKSRMLADPQGSGFYVVKLNRIVPGNALSQPGLITQVQTSFQESLTEEYAQQFLAAMRTQVGIERNEAAVAATKTRITGTN